MFLHFHYITSDKAVEMQTMTNVRKRKEKKVTVYDLMLPLMCNFSQNDPCIHM